VILTQAAYHAESDITLNYSAAIPIVTDSVMMMLVQNASL